MKRCLLPVCATFVLGALIVYAQEDRRPARSITGSQADVPRRLSDAELQRAVGGTKYDCCWRFSGQQCTQVLPLPHAINCERGDLGYGCSDATYHKICRWDVVLGPSNHDTCDQRSDDPNAGCNPPIAGWCMEWRSARCEPVVGGGCSCNDYAGDHTGIRMYCDYTSQSGFTSTICP
jgi:hypothetical protein